PSAKHAECALPAKRAGDLVQEPRAQARGEPVHRLDHDERRYRKPEAVCSAFDPEKEDMRQQRRRIEDHLEIDALDGADDPVTVAGGRGRVAGGVEDEDAGDERGGDHSSGVSGLELGPKCWGYSSCGARVRWRARYIEVWWAPKGRADR